jgi:hypothetical protein
MESEWELTLLSTMILQRWYFSLGRKDAEGESETGERALSSG